MKTAKQFLEEKDIKTFGAIICDGQQLVELLTEFAEKQASFISSKQDVIKSVCECSPKNNSWRIDNGVRTCMRCNKPDKQTFL